MATKTKKRGFLVYIPADTSQEIRREEFTGKTPAYQALRDAVSGLIQPVKLVYEDRARDGYVNEEGLIRGMPFNPRATKMWQAWGEKNGYMTRGQVLVGQAVLIFWEKIEAPADAVAESAPPTYRVSLSEWLAANTSSHDIFDSVALAAKFEADTGVRADWPTHSERETANSIKGRGKGGSLAMGTGKRLAYGYAIAEHFSNKHTDFKPWQNGLGFRWQSALEALKKAGY